MVRPERLDGDGERLCDYLSRATMRELTLETSLKHNLHKCHQQDQSPLFHKLPKEIRDLVFSFATDQYEDLDRKYSETSFHYRPGHRGPLRTSTSLLATCRRTWLETSQLPIRKSKVTMWFEGHRGPPASEQPKYDFAESWTSLNKGNFNTIHIFGQKHMLERMFHGSRLNWAHRRIVPKVLRVTMRHTDWFRWEDPLPLEFNQTWLQRALDNQDLSTIETFQLELETLEQNKDQLQLIIDRLMSVQGSPRPSNPVTELKRTEAPFIWHWNGPPNINGETHAAHAGMARLEYRVAVLTWRASRSSPGTVPPPAPANTGRANLFADPQRIRGPPGPRPLRMADFPTRRRLAQDGWQSMQFPFAQYMVATQSIAVSQAEEHHRNMMFQRMFADVKARELQEQWKTQGSLLRFE
ncbi:hypothetical protein DOTSEDRAFT_43923 [Dothistroma septosporum NZE10]|uniref:F-box domain-containing protein n=1 Tax=Dothistroma septosporum (strain NZE10 / CBS 128990) TaxID=675120 RepID=N1PTA6_DOTSN|nr:hypothetical protein DOTSEDRAFT_43923 [Dothistroma septosporum NZE10]